MCGCCRTPSPCSRCARACRRCSSRLPGSTRRPSPRSRSPRYSTASTAGSPACSTPPARWAPSWTRWPTRSRSASRRRSCCTYGSSRATGLGWVIALVFAVCIILRLARFNTLLEDTEQPPYAKEFFVGVPAPAGGLAALLPLMLTLQIGRDGWWNSDATVVVWTVGHRGAADQPHPDAVAEDDQGAGAGGRAAAGAGRPARRRGDHLPDARAGQRAGALPAARAVRGAPAPLAGKHPEAWDVPSKERRAIRRAHGAGRRLGLRPPRMRRVAGAARAVWPRRNGERAHGVRLPTDAPRMRRSLGRGRNWRRIGLRRNQSRPTATPRGPVGSRACLRSR